MSSYSPHSSESGCSSGWFTVGRSSWRFRRRNRPSTFTTYMICLTADPHNSLWTIVLFLPAHLEPRLVDQLSMAADSSLLSLRLVSFSASQLSSLTSVTVGLLSASLGWLALLLAFVLQVAFVLGWIPDQLWVYFSTPAVPCRGLGFVSVDVLQS